MKIGITQRIYENETYEEVRDALSHDWTVFLQAVFPDAVVIPVPNQLTNREDYFDNVGIDLLILSNGEDVGSAPLRDTLEMWLLDYCIGNEIPILGACRGFQMLNTYFGGSVVSDISALTSVKHVAAEHNVQLTDSLFQGIADAESLKVNSYHNQGVTLDGLGKDLYSLVMAEDNIVEGFCHTTKAILAIQWHPERPNPAATFDSRLIQKFVEQKVFWNTHE